MHISVTMIEPCKDLVHVHEAGKPGPVLIYTTDGLYLNPIDGLVVQVAQSNVGVSHDSS